MLNRLVSCFLTAGTRNLDSAGRRRFAPAIRLLVGAAMLVGCAGARPHAPEEPWRCNAAADEAVRAEDWVMARLLHESLLISQPHNCLTLYHLGYIAGHLGDRQQEFEYYHRAVGCGYDRDDKLFFNMGMALGDLGRTEQALEAFRRAVELDPLKADNHFGMGLTAAACDRPALAEAELREAVALDPRHWEARLGLAKLYLDDSRWAEARLQLEAVREGDPENEEAEQLLRMLDSRKSILY